MKKISNSNHEGLSPNLAPDGYGSGDASSNEFVKFAEENARIEKNTENDQTEKREEAENFAKGFVGLDGKKEYSIDAILKDKQACEKIDKRKENDNVDRSTALAVEDVFIQHSPSWFVLDNAINYNVSKTARYDDYCNHIDALCLVRPSSFDEAIPFGIDMTYNKSNDIKDEKSLVTKFQHEYPRKNMENKKIFGIQRIKYFKTPNDMGFRKGAIESVPRFVVCLNPEWAHIIKDRTDHRKVSDAIFQESTDKVRESALMQLSEQAEAMKEYYDFRYPNEEAYKKDELKEYDIKIIEDARVRIEKLIPFFKKALESFKLDPDTKKGYAERDEYQEASSVQSTATFSLKTSSKKARPAWASVQKL